VAEQYKAAFTLAIFPVKSHATVTAAALALVTLGTLAVSRGLAENYANANAP